jgi:hypothetical protein
MDTHAQFTRPIFAENEMASLFCGARSPRVTIAENSKLENAPVYRTRET